MMNYQGREVIRYGIKIISKINRRKRGKAKGTGEEVKESLILDYRKIIRKGIIYKGRKTLSR
jgi:hypothetical protein